ncbi:MAG: hypothetical protein QNJ72_10635 [Pleurocapsa sp. MO_226.B13]|nr:hypothetical protein [Pleurocapsa sp. MO_226.B13]
MTNTSNNLSEHQAIKQTAQFYIDGAIAGKSEIMSRALIDGQNFKQEN